MASPFHYPKSKHKRTISPPAYRDYRRYKPALRQEFEGQCVYCRAVDAVKGLDNFGVDHYRPQKHYPRLAAEYLNLFYACNRCNRLKRDFWPSATHRRNGQFVPNPCEHVMWDHLRYRGATVSAASAAGTWTVDLLDLNESAGVRFREGYLSALQLLTVEIAKAKATVAEVKKLLDNTPTAAGKASVATDLQVAEGNRDRLLAGLQKLLGK